MTSPAAIFRGRTRKEEKRAQREARRLRVGLLRDAVFARARWRCEWCKDGKAEHLHHLRGGVGRRRQEEAVETCVALCVECHDYAHKHPRNPRRKE